uniref:Uncharacterized protein n=1 Tax=Anopheles atroparvus TaxID=41427 RepID=A0A182ISE5_ANOAO
MFAISGSVGSYARAATSVNSSSSGSSHIPAYGFVQTEGFMFKRRKIIIHVPVKVNKQKHVHTEVKTVHHHHKPTVIKEEKIVKQEVHKPVVIKEEVEHEHFHHHYKHDHPTFEFDGHDSNGFGSGLNS